MTTTEPTIGEMLKNLRDVVDARDSLSNQDAELARQEAELKYQLQCKAQEQGVPGFKTENGSFSYAEDIRFRADPEQWEAIMRWAIDTGNFQVMHKRLTDSRLKAILLDGEKLPDGLIPEPFIKTSFRRS